MRPALSTIEFDETQAIRKYFEDSLLTRRRRATPISTQEVLVLANDAVLVTGLGA